MRIGSGEHVYEWVENWATIPNTPTGRENGRTHGVSVTEAGEVVIFHQADPAVLIFAPDGKLKTAWGDRFRGAHGMTLVKDNGTEYLWLTDEHSGEVVKTSLDGRTVMSLPRPELRVYQAGVYSPTWVAVYETRFGGNGDVWVADGYGMNHVHRFDKAGGYLGSINGSEGKAGPFNCPHGIVIDYRKSEREFYIADRGNKRFQVYGPDGDFKRIAGAGILSCPCGGVGDGDALVVPELSAKLTILDERDRLVCYLGENEKTCALPGWPNHPRELVKAGKFVSPHGAAVDRAGNLYVVEWMIGGRITQLRKCQS